mmetsp:Transcript_75350/g.243701  ORF Transcript_75350/g.243701 Transcript_75350/m.243701 type:complete len:208 (+) Transcript_75350:1503-2126(+)
MCAVCTGDPYRCASRASFSCLCIFLACSSSSLYFFSSAFACCRNMEVSAKASRLSLRLFCSMTSFCFTISSLGEPPHRTAKSKPHCQKWLFTDMLSSVPFSANSFIRLDRNLSTAARDFSSLRNQNGTLRPATFSARAFAGAVSAGTVSAGAVSAGTAFSTMTAAGLWTSIIRSCCLLMLALSTRLGPGSPDTTELTARPAPGRSPW